MDEKLDCKEIQIGSSWDFFDKEIDLDTSCVLFNDFGKIYDAVYFNQLESKNKSIIHSGDNKNGKGEGFDEIISINLDNIDVEVKALIIVINCCKFGDFSMVETAEINVINKDENQTIKEYSLGSLKNTGLNNCYIKRIHILYFI
jgi:tellurium resistance protein TerZ